MSDSEKKRLADAAADERAPAFPGDCAATFDALPVSAPDEFGSWAKGKSQTLRDVFPTPEAFQAAADTVARRVVAPCRYTSHLTADGAIMIDHETGDIYPIHEVPLD